MAAMGLPERQGDDEIRWRGVMRLSSFTRLAATWPARHSLEARAEAVVDLRHGIVT